ncbi:hypothetical protein JOM56_009891 [Amanita muscaria]
MKTGFSLLVSVILAVRVTFAANDWSVPCTSGACSYDLPANNKSSSGTLKIWGSQSAISDITPVAGWHILGCDRNATAQDIRLICTSSSAPCDHLFDNGGAEGKVIRLPENCGKNAFARVAKSWISEDQAIPTRVAADIQRRDGKLSHVQALSFDTHFHAIDATKMGQVSFAIQAATIPGVHHKIDTHPVSSRSDHLEERGLFGHIVSKLIASIKTLSEFNVNKSVTFDPINISKNGTVFRTTIDCPPLTPGIEVDMDAKVHAQVTLGVAASGTITPPSVEDFGVLAMLSADVSGTITLQADVETSILDTGKIKIFEVGLPGLDFPGLNAPRILSIGPTFQINAEAKASLDLAVGATVGIDYRLDQAQVVFPPRDGQKGTVNNFALHSTPLKLSATPFIQATGTVEAHVIPSLNLGVSAFTAQTGIYVNLDSSAVFTITLNGTKPAIQPREAASPDAGLIGASRATSPSVLEERAASQNAPFNGCFEIDAVIDFNVGADTGFFKIFDANVQTTFFAKTFQLFKVKCPLFLFFRLGC